MNRYRGVALLMVAGLTVAIQNLSRLAYANNFVFGRSSRADILVTGSSHGSYEYDTYYGPIIILSLEGHALTRNIVLILVLAPVRLNNKFVFALLCRDLSKMVLCNGLDSSTDDLNNSDLACFQCDVADPFSPRLGGHNMC